nr:DJ-1 family glyoxalase III [uncultured Cetobacterium sp.]
MNKTIFVMLANGFELIEAMGPIDVLRRCGMNVVTVSTEEDTLEIESAQKVKISADTLLINVDPNDGEGIIVPGGYPGYISLRENKRVVEIVKSYLENGKIVGAICGGPTLLGVNNFIGDYSFTCHSSTVEEMNSDKYSKEDVVIDRNLITSPGAGKCLEFGFALATKFVDEETINNVKKGMELL